MARKRAFGWFGPVSGILFAVLLIVSFVVMGDGPDVDVDDSAAKIAAALEQSRDGAEAAFPIFALSLFFFVFFLAYLRDHLQRVGEEGAWLVSALWASGLLFAAMFLVQVLVVQAGQFAVDDYGTDTQVAKALFALGWNSFFVLGPPLAAFGASAAVLFLGGFVPWMGWALLALWVLLASIVLLVQERERATAPTTPGETQATTSSS